MLYDIAVGAITTGVNHPTFLALNVVIGLLWLTLVYMLYHTATTEHLKPLAPHFALMLGICTCLSLLINWYIASVGLTATEDQKAELVSGKDGEGHAVDNAQELDPEIAERLRMLPLHSEIDLSLQNAGKFDTSGLAIQPLQGTDLFAVAGIDNMKAKAS